MSAVQLRNILLGSVGALIVLIGVLVYYAHNFLEAETVKTTHTAIDAEISARDVERLKRLERILKEDQGSVQKAEQIVAATKQYQYQDQIVSDINSYAAQTGVTVTAYDFSADSTAPASKPVSGVKSITATLTLKSPLPFDNYLRFLKAIEQNLTKMQVSGVNLTPDPIDIYNVVNPTIGLVVYVR